MSAVWNELRSSEREALILDCATRMAALFRRLPMLIGFTVQESASLPADRVTAPLDGELSLADVSVEAWPGVQPSPELQAAIAATILEMLEEHPGAREFLCGYTYARAYH
jgi:hypothetical protein